MENSTNFNEKDLKKVATGAFTSLAGSFIGKGLFFFSQIIIARLLGTEAYGLYALGAAVVRICDIVARLGLNMGGMRFISIHAGTDQSRLKGVFVSSVGISVISAAILAFFLHLSADSIADLAFHKPSLADTIRLFAYSLPFVSGVTVLSSLLQGSHILKYSVLMREIVQPSANILLVILFSIAGYHLAGTIAAFTISHILSVIAGLLFAGRLFTELLDRGIRPVYEIKDLLSYSIPLLFVGFLQYFLAWTDVLMLGRMGTTTDVGIYRAASEVPFVMTLFLVATNSIYAPMAAKLFKQGEMERLASIFKTTTRWVIYAIVPICVFLVSSAESIMAMFGTGYIETGKIVLVVLCFGQLINCATGGVGYTLTMAGKQKVELLNCLASLALTVLLNLLLIPHYGIVGVALSSAISVIVINLLRVTQIRLMFKIQPYSAKAAAVIFPAITSIVMIIISHRAFPATSSILLNGVAIVATFALWLYFARLSDEDRYLICIIRSRLNSHMSH